LFIAYQSTRDWANVVMQSSEVIRFAIANRIAQSKDPFSIHRPSGFSGNFRKHGIVQTPLALVAPPQ
jgi:hypothetical protein